MWYKELFGIGDTAENLETAADGKNYEERYRALLKNIETATVFKRGEVKISECHNCGHIIIGTKAPKVCPVCAHAQSYFEVRAENY